MQPASGVIGDGVSLALNCMVKY